MMEFLIKFFSPIQLIGYVGTACALISYQCKRNKNYFLFQTGCAIAFAIQFVLLRSWAGMFLNAFSIMRGVIFALGDKCRKRGYLILIEACFAFSCILACLAFGEKWWIALILFAAQGGGTLAMWTRKGKVIRIAQLCLISPMWIVNNVYYFSVGGILCEVFNMISVIVSFIRFGKTGYDNT
ncbi:MAG: YgjV family protein [Eubacteriales bacterium]